MLILFLYLKRTYSQWGEPLLDNILVKPNEQARDWALESRCALEQATYWVANARMSLRIRTSNEQAR
jgi:hypothetical protein